MKGLFKKVVRENCGLAGIEFAIVLPVLLVVLGGVADFALAFWSKGLLASSVAQGAQYAFLVGPQSFSNPEVSAISIQNIKSIVRQRLSLPAENITVKGPPVSAADLLKICGQRCPPTTPPTTQLDSYLTISARYTYVPFLPFYSHMVKSPDLVEAATVRLK